MSLDLWQDVASCSTVSGVQVHSIETSEQTVLMVIISQKIILSSYTDTTTSIAEKNSSIKHITLIGSSWSSASKNHQIVQSTCNKVHWGSLAPAACEMHVGIQESSCSCWLLDSLLAFRVDFRVSVVYVNDVVNTLRPYIYMFCATGSIH